MMPGVGVDLVPEARVARLLAKWGDAVVEELLTEAEERQAPQSVAGRARFVAGRMAMKEAVLKALGCGTRVRWRDIEIAVDEWGAPQVSVHGALARTWLGGRELAVGLTHDAGMVVAVAVAAPPARRSGMPPASMRARRAFIGGAPRAQWPRSANRDTKPQNSDTGTPSGEHLENM